MIETDPKCALERAIDLAAFRHCGQRDKSGQPYILHVLRVMFKGKNIDEMIVGVLHDIVEDTCTTVQEIDERFGEKISNAVLCLSHNDNEPNIEYYARILTDPLATQVKIYDLLDNLDHERMANLTPLDRERLSQKYYKALRILRNEPEPGHASTGDANAARIVVDRLEGKR